MQVRIKVDINVKEVMGIVNSAAEEGLRDTVVETAADVVKGSPVAKIRGGTNRRSIDYWVRKLRAKIFSTSGYGGWLEIGHHTRSGSFVAARPYFRPAADRHFKNLIPNIAKRLKVRGG